MNATFRAFLAKDPIRPWALAIGIVGPAVICLHALWNHTFGASPLPVLVMTAATWTVVAATFHFSYRMHLLVEQSRIEAEAELAAAEPPGSSTLYQLELGQPRNPPVYIVIGDYPAQVDALARRFNAVCSSPSGHCAVFSTDTPWPAIRDMAMELAKDNPAAVTLMVLQADLTAMAGGLSDELAQAFLTQPIKVQIAKGARVQVHYPPSTKNAN